MQDAGFGGQGLNLNALPRHLYPASCILIRAMSNDATPDADERHKWSPWAIAAAALLLLMFGVIAVGTIRGCFFGQSEQADDAGDKKKKEETEKKKKPDFVIDSPVVLPSEPNVPTPPVKPGHWATASQKMTANYRDFVGDSRLTIADNQNRPYAVASTPFYVRSSRPVLLSKGRPKATQTTFFAPQSGQTVRMVLDLEERGLGAGPQQGFTKLAPMPSYQYNFVVLAKSPSRYSYIKTLDSVKSPFNGESDEDNTEDALHYLVVELGADQIASLPDNPLTWTSTAYVLWDQIDPGEPFPAEQKKALVDWLHWGGQLIINGPDSLDQLRGSFLDPYLPATNGGPRKFGDNDIAELNANWTILTLPVVPLRPTAPWSGITLNLRPGGDFVLNTGKLFAERQVGRGRIVVSAIQLSERDFINWRSGFESFFNACLLRRPPRKYIPGHFGGITMNWADDRLKERRLDASLNTTLYYFARDLGVATSYRHEAVLDDQDQQGQQGRTGLGVRGRANQPATPQTTQAYRPPDNPGGIGAWNDFSATAGAARLSLREAAGVEVPDSSFVVLCLAAYLITLVPLNWLVFNTLGRIEWAWIAAPIIAIVGTWVIVQRARLDIGFVRSQTEIAVVEQQPDHSRAHLSRYTALYTSLSTTYDFEFGNMTTLIAPFPANSNASDFQLLSGQDLTPVNFQRYDHVQLTGLPISSNSTGMVHSEQMLTLDGPIKIAKSTATKREQIENLSKMDLHSVCVLKKLTPEEVEQQTDKHEFEGRCVGDLLPGQSIPVPKTAVNTNKPLFAEDRAAETRTQRRDRLNLEQLFQLALDPKNIESGETRLVARFDEVLPGQAITPSASQIRGAALVVVHLRYAPLQPPVKDSNTRQEIKNKEPDDNEPIKF